jgi:hypothetical protein
MATPFELAFFKSHQIPVKLYNNSSFYIYTGTRINDAMLKGITFLNTAEDDTKRMKLIVFLTDGQAESGRDFILKNVKNANSKGVAIFSLAFGNFIIKLKLLKLFCRAGISDFELTILSCYSLMPRSNKCQIYILV